MNDNNVLKQALPEQWCRYEGDEEEWLQYIHLLQNIPLTSARDNNGETGLSSSHDTPLWKDLNIGGGEILPRTIMKIM
jgi:hypothetical protein